MKARTLFLVPVASVLVSGPILAEVGLKRLDEAYSLILVQGTPGDITPHAPTFRVDSENAEVRRIPATSEDSALRPRRWNILIDLDPSLVLNRTGDLNGDGPPSLGLGDTANLPPPTIVWSRQIGPNNHDPVYAQFVNSYWSEPIAIATDPGDDRDPCWWQDAAGNIHAAWWRSGTTGAGGEVLYANRSLGSSNFSQEESVSLSGQPARSASIAVLSSGEVLVGYETDPVNGARNVFVASKVSPMSAFQPEIISTTSYAGETKPEVSNKLGHIWLTWIDSTNRVGYSESTDSVWTSPSYEPYAGEGDIGRARMSIQTRILSCSGSLTTRRVFTGLERTPLLPESY